MDTDSSFEHTPRAIAELFHSEPEYSSERAGAMEYESWSGHNADGEFAVSIEYTSRGRWELLVVRGTAPDCRDRHAYLAAEVTRDARIAALVALARADN